MAYAVVLPRDTQTDIDEIVEGQFVGKLGQLAGVDAIEQELQHLATNPTLGAVVFGGPYESRRIYKCSIRVDGYRPVELEFAYRLNAHKQQITISSARVVAA